MAEIISHRIRIIRPPSWGASVMISISHTQVEFWNEALVARVIHLFAHLSRPSLISGNICLLLLWLPRDSIVATGRPESRANGGGKSQPFAGGGALH